MKVRITVVAVITVQDDEEYKDLLALADQEICEEIFNADRLAVTVQRADDEELTSECGFCGEPTVPGYPLCQECYENAGGDNDE